MIVVKIFSGLGNQMFQYASGLALSKKLGTECICDLSSYKNDELRECSLKGFKLSSKLQTNIIKQLKSKKSIKHWINFLLSKKLIELNDPVWEILPQFFTIDADIIILNGYWAWKDYFANNRKQLLNDFELKSNLSAELQLWKNELSKCSVAIHIRRSDYLKPEESKNFGVLPFSYYSDAMNYINQKIFNPYFYIFSDDVEWVRENWLTKMQSLGNCLLVESNRMSPPALEMKKISVCDHQIIANSSFSWWAAWLNENPDKIVLQPQKWYNNREWQKVYEQGNLNTEHGWIKI